MILVIITFIISIVSVLDFSHVGHLYLLSGLGLRVVGIRLSDSPVFVFILFPPLGGYGVCLRQGWYSPLFMVVMSRVFPGSIEDRG